MKITPVYLYTVLACLMLAPVLPAQTTRILSKESTDSLFSEATKKSLDIKYDIWRVYQYNDKGGRYYVVLSEHNLIVPGKDTIIDKIEGFCLQDNNGQLTQQWKLKDAIDSSEQKIWFWTKYSEVKDLDGDGYIEPLIIYGSADNNEQQEYHRLKLLLYYKGNKVALRFSMGAAGEKQSVQRDKAFNTLPPAIQSHIYTVLRHINKDQDFIWDSSAAPGE